MIVPSQLRNVRLDNGNRCDLSRVTEISINPKKWPYILAIVKLCHFKLFVYLGSDHM